MIVSNSDHNVIVFELDNSNVYTNCCPWPTYRHDIMRTANYTTVISVMGSGVSENNGILPFYTRISGCTPNPFIRYLNLSVDLAERADIKIFIYNIAGAMVSTLDCGYKDPGYHCLRINNIDNKKHLSSGIYFMRVVTTDGVSDKDLGIIKIIYCK
jgi:hypothetical protein